MKDQLLESWRIHQKMNLLLLDNITDGGMQNSLSIRGGRTVYQQWAHIHNVRLQWLEVCAPDIFRKYKTISKDATFERKMLRNALIASAGGLETLFERGFENGGKIKGYKKGVIVMLGYFISHESHHRGNMILTLKQCGEKIPDTVKWGIWEWNK